MRRGKVSGMGKWGGGQRWRVMGKMVVGDLQVTGRRGERDGLTV